MEENKDIKRQKLSERYSKNEIILAVGRNKGIKSAVCRELSCTPLEFNNYLNIHADIKPLIAEAKKELVSLAEEKLLQNLNSDDQKTSERAAEFILKTLGKDYYSESPQVQIAQQINITDKEAAIKNIFGIE